MTFPLERAGDVESESEGTTEFRMIHSNNQIKVSQTAQFKRAREEEEKQKMCLFL